METHIEIEKMLFGDYRVCVWDERNLGLLDKQYFCRGFNSAYLTAKEIQADLFKGLPIYSRDIDKLELIK